MKKIYLFAVVIGLTSCFSIKRQDYSLYESFQIGNTSSKEVTLQFYAEGAPMMAYYELHDQSSPLLLSIKDSEKSTNEVQQGTELTLEAGQTALFYSNRNRHYSGSKVNCLYLCGDGLSMYLFYNRPFFIGDSVTISFPDAMPQVLRIEKNEQWETWYDESSSVYNHFWRIE